MGYLQEAILKIGKAKGFVTSSDVKDFYLPQEMNRQMNKLVLRGYFKEPEDCGTYIKWKCKEVK